MATATLDGFPVFGSAITVVPGGNNREIQENGYFGLSGTETLDGGFRTREMGVRSLLGGSGIGGLATAVGLLEAFDDGGGHLFVDTLGRVWSNCIVSRVRPRGRYFSDGRGNYFQEYEATITCNGG